MVKVHYMLDVRRLRRNICSVYFIFSSSIRSNEYTTSGNTVDCSNFSAPGIYLHQRSADHYASHHECK